MTEEQIAKLTEEQSVKLREIQIASIVFIHECIYGKNCEPGDGPSVVGLNDYIDEHTCFTAAQRQNLRERVQAAYDAGSIPYERN